MNQTGHWAPGHHSNHYIGYRHAVKERRPTLEWLLRRLYWRHGEYYCHVFVDLNFNTARIRYLDPDNGFSEWALEC